MSIKLALLAGVLFIAQSSSKPAVASAGDEAERFHLSELRQAG